VPEAALAQVRIAYPILDISVKSIPSGSPMVTAHVRWLGGSLPAREVSFWVRGPSFVHHLSFAIAWTSRRWTPPATSRYLTRRPCPAAEYACTAGRWEGVAMIRWTNPDDGLQERHGKIDSE